MADGCVEIVFHYRGIFDEIDASGTVGYSPLSNIQAQSTAFRRFSTQESFGIFGAYLYPFATAAILVSGLGLHKYHAGSRIGFR